MVGLRADCFSQSKHSEPGGLKVPEVQIMTEDAFRKILREYRLVAKIAPALSPSRSTIFVYDLKSAVDFLEKPLPRLAKVWLDVYEGEDSESLIEIEIPEGKTYADLPKYIEMECSLLCNNDIRRRYVPAFFVQYSSPSNEFFGLDIFSARNDHMTNVMIDLMQKIAHRD